MRIVFFDLGQTLEDQGTLLPGARETLSAIKAMRDPNGEAPVLALISNYYEADKPDEVEVFQKQYYKLLEDLGIISFFEPLSERVTISTEVGVRKPNEKIFRVAINKIHKDLPYHHVIFITENQDHIAAVREVGMMAIHFQGPGQSTGEVS
ncbi:MAG: hypothetical protein MN733_36320, partial [Nitrososphaera sp.]|nr:hypothetical protein [Nitrososphaera sp.]